MLKPLTLSLSLAVALGACSVSMAGLFGTGGSGCSTCGIASPQGVYPTAQYAAPVASAQCDTGCAAPSPCAAPSGCNLKKKVLGCFNKPKCYTYEWVLKKKLVWGHKAPACDTGCPTTYTPTVYPSGQGYASPQGYSSPQAYAAPQAYGSGQAYAAPQATATSAPAAPAGDEVPPAPEVAPAAPPAPPAAPANAPQSSLLFSTPSGN